MSILKRQKIRIIFLLVLVNLIRETINSDIMEIELKLEEIESSFALSKMVSIIYYIKGSIDTNKKYILLSSEGMYKNVKNSPYMFITKNMNFNKNYDEYDFTSIKQDENGNKLAIESNFFNENEINGFYLNLTCIPSCDKGFLNISLVDDIILQVGEKLSFYNKNEDIFSFIINVETTSSIENDVTFFVLKGGSKEQVSMLINDYEAVELLPDTIGGFLVSKDDTVQIHINGTSKNLKLSFFSDYYNPNTLETIIRNIREGEYNQYNIVEGGDKIDCFNVLHFEDDFSSEIQSQLTLIGEREFNVIMECYYENKKLNKTYKSLNSEKYVVSSDLFCQGAINKICVSFPENGVFLTLIHIHKKIIEKNDGNTEVRKMSEPLINDITYTFYLPTLNYYNSNNNINLHTHSHFYGKNYIESNFYSNNVIIKVNYGKIKVYKDLCLTYPYCSFTQKYLSKSISEENNQTNFQTINSNDGTYYINLYSDEDFYYMSNHQIIIVIACIESDINECSYDIAISSSQSIKKLYNQSIVSKYIAPYKEINIYNNTYKKEDVYVVYPFSQSQVIINLVIYSGDAYLEPLTNISCCHKKEILFGTNLKIKIKCNNNDINEKNEYFFSIRSKIYGAFYSIYSQYIENNLEKAENTWLLGMSVIGEINKESENLYLKYNSAPLSSENNKNKKLIVLFNLLNCDLKIRNNDSRSIFNSYNNSNLFQDYIDSSIFDFGLLKNDSIKYIIQNRDSKKGENEKCLYYISSFDLMDEKSFLILPENKPLIFILNEKVPKIRIKYPFINSFLSEDEKVNLNIHLLNDNLPINLKIIIGNENEKIFKIYYSTNIELSPMINNRNYQLTQILLIFEFIKIPNNKDKLIIDIDLKTSNNIPYYLGSKQLVLSNIKFNSMHYYISLIDKNTYGNIYINFIREKGKITARLLDISKKNKFEWNNMTIFSDKHSLYSLKYDYYKQEITLTKEETKVCKKYCYLIFRIEPFKISGKNNIYNLDYYFSYSLYFNNLSLRNENQHYLLIFINELIVGNLQNEQTNNNYKYQINEDSEQITLFFKSNNCKLILCFNSEFSEENKNCRNYFSFGENKFFIIYKSEILSLVDKQDLFEVFLFIKITPNININNKLIDINKIDMRYKFKINSPISIMDDIIPIKFDSSGHCEIKNRSFCDFLFDINSYNKLDNIYLSAESVNNDELSIFINVMTNEDFYSFLLSENLPSWPTKEKFDYSGYNSEHYNFIKIDYNDIKEKFTDFIRPILLIRVYTKNNASSIDLFSSFINNNNSNLKIIPYMQDSQLLIADGSDLSITIPTYYEYKCYFNLVNNKTKGLISINNKNYSLFNKDDSLVISTGLSKSNSNIFKIILNNNEKFSQFPIYFMCKKDTYEKNNNKKTLNNKNELIIQKGDKFPFNYYIQIKELNTDLTISIFFKELNYTNNNDNKNDVNSLSDIASITEDFEINGFLIDEENLLEFKSNNYNRIKELDTSISGSYDKILRRGNINFEINRINEYINKNNNKGPFYAYISINKGSINKKNYNYINYESSLLVNYNNNDPIIVFPDKYIINSVKVNNYNNDIIRHVYKLNGIIDSLNDINKMKIEFSSNDKAFDFYVRKDVNIINSSFNNDIKYFDAQKSISINELGKNIMILNKNINDAYLVIEYKPINPFNSEIVYYTFKYSVITSNKKYYSYNSKFKVIKKDNRLYLTINQIKSIDTENKILFVNYYIRLYPLSSFTQNEFTNSINFKTNTIYSIYKVSKINSLLDENKSNFKVDIPFNYDERLYIDVIAEIKSELYSEEYFGYTRVEVVGINKEKRLFYISIFILFCSLIIIIIIIALKFIYKGKQKNIADKVAKISFTISRLSLDTESNNPEEKILGDEEQILK